ncbi:hypothetical protein NEMBOFW57_003177 [Staphylotrichum longicolle]|uniref:Peptidase A1 domain-containing protein n=1 Tax=Staphylotrichum longicolle TaxID=669026 RepID=A0AAD4I337_9PEZI|nr:hypothetical protein NEMBOFW57_003177 [Staphylotrichum longicolle]
MIPSASKLVVFTLLPLALAAVEPKQAVWAGATFGPDGPWNAVEVSIGGQPKISLFPGRMWHTFVTTSDYCAFNNSVPHCGSGTYLKDSAVAGSSTTSPAGAARRIEYKPPTQQLNAGVEARGSANLYLDKIDMQFSSGLVQNHSVALIESQSQMLAYPGGTLYPVFTGCLNVGAPDPQQIFTGGGGKAGVNASMIPWALKEAGTIPSSSFGLHYGSASPSAKVSGSLVFGGYDRNRVVGDVLSLDGDLWSSVTLQNITLRVIKGNSPFPSLSDGSTPNLLIQGNSSMPTAGLPVLLDPCSPYLTLPRSTCDAIASHLPVTYNASLGLYLWNTTSPLYSRVVTSPSTLALTFMGASNTESLTIHVPFTHLNLTLSPPFVTGAPVPYFPCFTGGVGAYVLGRAFFQDAFLGANWETKRMWLAQAPGPNIPAGVDVAAVQSSEDGAIGAGKNQWEASWDGVWKALGDEETGDGSNNSTAGRTGDGSSGTSVGGAAEGGGSSGLSTGAVAGIGVGAAVGGMILIAAVGWFLWRRRRGAEAVSPAVTQVTPAPGTAGEPSLGGYYDEAKELSGMNGPVEAPAGERSPYYEMPGDQPVGQWHPR